MRLPAVPQREGALTIRRLTFATLLALLLSLPSPSTGEAAPWCGESHVTGYNRYAFSSRTYDGTSIYADIPIVAASWDIEMGATVWIEGLGTFVVHDRGRLGNGYPKPWIDVAVWSDAEALALTGEYYICVS